MFAGTLGLDAVVTMGVKRARRPTVCNILKRTHQIVGYVGHTHVTTAFNGAVIVVALSAFPAVMMKTVMSASKWVESYYRMRSTRPIGFMDGS